jgi:flagellar hook-associated protein 3 FlgL
MLASARGDAARAREAAQAAQDVVARGTRISHPGDDPAGAGKMVALQMSSERFAAIQNATAVASDELGAADAALDGVSTALSRARELAVQLGSGGYSDSQRAMGGEEIGYLIGQVVSSLNTRLGNLYLFGGNRDGDAPFTSTGVYLGDDAARQVEVAPGVYQQANVRADVMMGVAAGTDVFGTLQALRTALEGNDTDGVRNVLDALDESINQVATARAQTGASMNALDAASAAARLTSGDDQIRAVKQGEVDIAEAAIQLQATQTALQASLAAAAHSFRISLLDYLG